MNATETPKKNNNIETAPAKAFSNILLSSPKPLSPVLKSKASKIEMPLNGSILLEMIYVEADTNVL
jgi:hypothetical protein